MAAAVLVPCGVRLRSDFDAIAPGRNKASDGWIGDTAHQQETSDHNPDETGSVPIHDADRVNEVHAIDVDSDLREFDLTMEKVVQFLLGRCRSGAEKRLRYIIYNRRIWEASNGWRLRTYTGPSPHTEHAHFSFSYDTTLEASTVSYRLEDIPVALTAADKTWMQNTFGAQISTAKQEIKDEVAELLAKVPGGVWGHLVDRVNPQPGDTARVTMGAIQQFAEQKLAEQGDRIINELTPAA
jgi:hypothetical protein